MVGDKHVAHLRATENPETRELYPLFEKEEQNYYNRSLTLFFASNLLETRHRRFTYTDVCSFDIITRLTRASEPLRAPAPPYLYDNFSLKCEHIFP